MTVLWLMSLHKVTTPLKFFPIAEEETFGEIQIQTWPTSLEESYLSTESHENIFNFIIFHVSDHQLQ